MGCAVGLGYFGFEALLAIKPQSCRDRRKRSFFPLAKVCHKCSTKAAVITGLRDFFDLRKFGVWLTGVALTARPSQKLL
jgi:hypothetical protein